MRPVHTSHLPSFRVIYHTMFGRCSLDQLAYRYLAPMVENDIDACMCLAYLRCLFNIRLRQLEQGKLPRVERL